MKPIPSVLSWVGSSQVFLVAMNTVFVSSGHKIPMFVTGLGISLVWSWNIKKIAFSTIKERLKYSFGAATGTVLGWFLATYIKSFL